MWQPPFNLKEVCSSIKGSNTSDFRPVSLLPILSKVLERHLCAHIKEYLSEHSPLANCHPWGFQEGKSTVSAPLHVTNDWFQNLERNHEVGAVFFDFHKATLFPMSHSSQNSKSST